MRDDDLDVEELREAEELRALLELLPCPEIVGEIADPDAPDGPPVAVRCNSPFRLEYTTSTTTRPFTSIHVNLVCTGSEPERGQERDRRLHGPHRVRGPIDSLWSGLALAESAVTGLSGSDIEARNELIDLAWTIAEAGGDDAAPMLALDYAYKLDAFARTHNSITRGMWDAYFRYWGSAPHTETA